LLSIAAPALFRAAGSPPRRCSCSVVSCCGTRRRRRIRICTRGFRRLRLGSLAWGSCACRGCRWRSLCCGRCVDCSQRSNLEFQFKWRLGRQREVDFHCCGGKSELRDLDPVMAAGQARQVELPIFIGPTDPRFSRGSLNDAQRGAGNRCAFRCAHDASQTRFGRSIRLRVFLRRERDSEGCNQREQNCESSSQHLTRPFGL